MDRHETPSERIKSALSDSERSKAWLARNTQIPLTTLDRKLRGDGSDFTLAQAHVIAEVLDLDISELILPTDAQAAAS